MADWLVLGVFVDRAYNEEGMIILALYKGTDPYFYYFKHGLEEEKQVSLNLQPPCVDTFQYEIFLCDVQE